jgi:hypothetical protein
VGIAHIVMEFLATFISNDRSVGRDFKVEPKVTSVLIIRTVLLFSSSLQSSFIWALYRSNAELNTYVKALEKVS